MAGVMHPFIIYALPIVTATSFNDLPIARTLHHKNFAYLYCNIFYYSMNSRFQIATHILTLLHHMQGELVSSDYIAGSVNANPALIRKELTILRKAGLVESREGKAGGYLLGRPADKITMGDIYQTVKNETPFGVAKNQPNPDCPVGRQINQHINKLYLQVDDRIMFYLKGITLLDFSGQVK